VKSNVNEPVINRNLAEQSDAFFFFSCSYNVLLGIYLRTNALVELNGTHQHLVSADDVNVLSENIKIPLRKTQKL
jgi:hypothetical protein